MAKRQEIIEDFEELDAVLDKMRVLTMALWGCEDADPKEEFMSSLSSFASDIVADLEKVLEKNKPKPLSTLDRKENTFGEIKNLVRS